MMVVKGFNSLEEELEEDGTASSLAAMRESCQEVRATREDTAMERTELRLTAKLEREATVLEASILHVNGCTAMVVSRRDMFERKKKKTIMQSGTAVIEPGEV